MGSKKSISHFSNGLKANIGIRRIVEQLVGHLIL